MNFFARQAMAFRNDMKRSAGALVGIIQGMLADGSLNDREILFLRDWLAQNETIAAAWPGNVLAARISAILTDGQITTAEREQLTQVLQSIIGTDPYQDPHAPQVCQLALDSIEQVHFEGRVFCLTGDFMFGSRSTCEAHIIRRGGRMAGVSRKLDYLVVGGLGSPEWKHGSFGTKIEQAIAVKQSGARLLIVHEDAMASALMSHDA